ncbi:MAG: DUF1002 domain-containing protein [Lachnospiraceae bacterium]|nr:DUF1002 domain-containing protein [Lachnospiraceae bacterium]
MKHKLTALIMSAICLAAAIPSTVVLADGQKVVTLGADLSEEQRQMILRYFGVAGQNIETLTITNQDERNHLGSYVPLEQIGTRTYSCALVNPTASGGIQVKTANLSWVTSNMIATTLSTSGVVNCEVLAAAPFEVSGTGALTGIIMAYESAVGEALDEQKKELATQELITTTSIANSIGQQEATNIVNESKIQVIQGNVIHMDDINVIVDKVAEEENVSLTDEDKAGLLDLLEQIAEEDYDYEEMKDTLERVESNTSSTVIDDAAIVDESGDGTAETNSTVELNTSEASGEYEEQTEETETPETLAEDSILMNTDDSVLGEAVIIDATNEDALIDASPDIDSETSSEENSGISDELQNALDDVLGGTLDDAPEVDSGTESTLPDDNSFDVPDNTEQLPEDMNASFSEETGEDSVGDTANVLDGATDIMEEIPDSGEPLTEKAIDDAADTTEQNPEITDAVLDNAAQIPENGTDHTPDNSSELPAETDVIDSAVESPELTDESVGSALLSFDDFRFEPVTSEANGSLIQPAGINELTIYFLRSDITVGSGALVVYDTANDSVPYDTVNMNDTSRVAVKMMNNTELAKYGWTEGCKAVIELNQPLGQSSSYYVVLTEDAFMTSDSLSHTEPVEDQRWTIKTSQNGFYIQQSPDGTPAGASLTARILMDTAGMSADGATVYAAIQNVDTAIAEFSQYEFHETTDITITCLQPGTTTFTVTYFDGAGNQIGSENHTLTIE